MVVLIPDPEVVPPGVLVMIQVPLGGKPVKSTLPAETIHVGCVIVPTIGSEGFVFTVKNNDGYEKIFEISIDGRFNIENALAAITMSKVIGIDDDSIQKGLIRTKIQGRMNIFEKDGVTVIVDYAHNQWIEKINSFFNHSTELEIIAEKNIITYNQYFTNDIIKQKWQSIFY